ncbi:MAG: Maf family protein [Candidatus Nanopelagicales bacterium]
MTWDVVLGSASPARLGLLRSAGIDPRVMTAEVDEDGIAAAWDPADPAGLVQALADAKSVAVLRDRAPDPGTIVITADSLFVFDGQVLGKPGRADIARQRLTELAGQAGDLFTGHTAVIVDDSGQHRHVRGVARTEVRFADFTAAELDSYIATGEPLAVAGGFTLDGLASPFISGITGDPSNVIGLSMPLLRRLLADAGIFWPDLWDLTG